MLAKPNRRKLRGASGRVATSPDADGRDRHATSIKSIDLNAATYQDDARLTYRLNKYVDDVVEFNGANLANDEVKLSDIQGRALHLAIPKGSMTEAQRRAIEAARRRESLGDRPLDIIITEF
jgi:hypothetical protein